MVVAVTLVAYARSFTGEFQFDDHSQILDNPAVRDATWRGVLEWGTTRLIPLLTLAANYRLGGNDPVGYHAVNLVIHLLVAYVVYRLVFELCHTPRLRHSWMAERRLPLALGASLIIACHPIQVQAVTYVVQRMSTIAALFYLASVLWYVRSRNRAARGGGGLAYLIALLFAVAASLSKENAASLPLAIALSQSVFFGRADAGARALTLLVPFVLIALAIPITFTLTSRQVWWAPASRPPVASEPHAADAEPPAPPHAARPLVRLPGPQAPRPGESWIAHQTRELVEGLLRAAEPLEGMTPGNYFLTQCRVVPAYLRLVVLPWGFNIDHDVPIERHVSVRVAAGIVFLLGLFGFGLYATERWPLVGFGVLWCFIALSIESSVIPLRDVMNEHRMYLAMPGIGLVLAVAFIAVLRSRPLVAHCAGWAVIGLLVALTIARNETWRTQLSLWQDALTKSPGKGRVHTNVGTAVHLGGNLEGAIRHYCDALRLDPANTRAEENIQIALQELMERGEAELEITTVGEDGTIELVPRHPCPPDERPEPAENETD